MDEKFSTGNGWKSWKIFHSRFSKKFAGKRKKCLTEWDSVRYTVELQACPHLGLTEWPQSGDEFLRRIQNHEENFSAQEASAQGSSWLSDPHEHQERPQGHQCSSCKGPQEPDCLIWARVAMGQRRTEHAQKTADIELAVFFFIQLCVLTKKFRKNCTRKTPGQTFLAGVFLLYWQMSFAFVQGLFDSRRGRR